MTEAPSFLPILQGIDRDALRARIASATREDTQRVLRAAAWGAADKVPDSDLPVLFSPAMEAELEGLAHAAASLSLQRFGRVVQLYAPLYLSNECVNKCTYCGYSFDLKIARRTLTPDEVEAEARVLHAQGFRHILLVSGEDRRWVNMEYLKEVVRRLNPLFEAIAIEIQPLKEEEYRELVAEGVDGLALYQEIYDPEQYARVHVKGPKRNYDARVQSIEGGGRAGMRTLGIGALLGLADWRTEGVLLALHGRWLARTFWQSRIAVSFPRMRANAGGEQPPFPVSDPQIAQMIAATRLAMPDAELVMSTREPAHLRDGLIPLGITRTSAGSCTDPGGYSANDEGEHAGEQFEIEDTRPAAEVAEAIAAMGYEPVWKDFDRGFVLPARP